MTESVDVDSYLRANIRYYGTDEGSRSQELQEAGWDAPGWYLRDMAGDTLFGPFQSAGEASVAGRTYLESLGGPPRFVTPEVHWVGYSQLNEQGLRSYLIRSGNFDFVRSMDKAREQGLSDAEILCSFFAKLCYRSLTLGKNTNVSRTRDIWDNLVNCFDTAHGSIFEHVNFNFVVDRCSRVFSHELVRHRIGTAFSQTSGRYCRLDHIPIVWDPILDPVKDLFDECVRNIEDTVYLAECRLGLRKPPTDYPDVPPEVWVDQARHRGTLEPAVIADVERWKWVPDNSFDFTLRKKLTSAIRRIAPNGQSNEIGFSVNLRSLRHTILMRTARHAEWEIRHVFDQVYRLLRDSNRYPLIFHGAKENVVDGLIEVSGMRMQPYEKTAEMVLSEMSDEEIQLYLQTRGQSA